MNPSIVLGTFQNNNYQDLLNVVDAAFEKGCTAFDTAPSYGTETDLGKAIASCMSKYHVDREKVFVSDKVDAWQMIQGKGDVSSCKQSLRAVLRTLIKMYTFAPNFKFGTK